MDVDARLEALTEENERLREELAALKETLGFTYAPPLEWGLTGSEARMFGRLLRSAGAVTKDALMAALYRDFGKDEAEIKIVDVFICKMRKKLKPFGIEIHTIWGTGYQIPGPVRDEVLQRWPQARAA